MKINLLSSIFFLIGCLFISNLYSQKKIIVPDDYNTISKALNSASNNDTIFVRKGIYYENIVWPDTFGLKLISESGSSNTIIDGSNLNRVLSIESPSNCFFERDTSIMIKGFTIQNGNLVIGGYGGGILIEERDIKISDLILKNNKISGSERAGGGGIFVYDSKVSITNSIISENHITSSHWSDGAGINLSNCNAEIINTIISHNTVNGLWSFGGGCYIEESDAKISNCEISYNQSFTENWNYGTGLHLESFDSIYSVTIENSVIKGNRMENESIWRYGIAIYISGINCNIINTLIFDNKQINNSNDKVSAISIEKDFFYQNENNILNCTIADNEFAIEIREANLNLLNSVLWNESSKEIYNFIVPGLINAKNCIIKNGYIGENIITADPMFFGAEVYIPGPNSPCLNNGNSEFFPKNDILGNTRPLPAGSNPDIGAYEVDQYFSHILTRFYIDNENNGIYDPTDFLFADGGIIIDSTQYKRNSSTNGILSILPQGAVRIEYDPSILENWELSSTESSYDFFIDNIDFSDTIYFGIRPKITLIDISQAIISPPFRCNEKVKMQLLVKNFGTSVANGKVILQLDTLVKEFKFNPQPDKIDGNKVEWHINNLYPSSSVSKIIEIAVPGIPDIEIGDSLKFVSIIEFDNSIVNEYEYSGIIRCSFDPNDKLVNPERPDKLALLNSDLTYTIRFQNTGNDFARNVSIIDTLSENLDLTTFKLISTSHPNGLNYYFENNVLHFDFQDIYLCDSLTDQEKSNGFVIFSIKPKKEVQKYETIKNNAQIYFDFNPAIFTNTTNSIMVDKYPVKIKEIENHDIISIYPNPSKGTVKLSSTVDKVEVFDLHGRCIITNNKVNLIDMSNCHSGIYFVKIQNSGINHFKKVIIEN